MLVVRDEIVLHEHENQVMVEGQLADIDIKPPAMAGNDRIETVIRFHNFTVKSFLTHTLYNGYSLNPSK